MPAAHLNPALWTAARVLLVCMFPFSAIDKLLHRQSEAVISGCEATASRATIAGTS